ncbi:MAG: conjugal transfer protein TraL [Aquificota bacterium]|nr:MAG: conjugal transfer protein TraL [Aquificota bacterium]
MAEQQRNRRFPQYLSSPIQVLWFEADELSIILLSFMAASILKGYFWLMVIVAPFFYSRYKLRYPRGFLKHMLYLSGLKDLKVYPTAFHKEFLE